MLLSGGLDSSLVASVASRHLGQQASIAMLGGSLSVLAVPAVWQHHRTTQRKGAHGLGGVTRMLMACKVLTTSPGLRRPVGPETFQLSFLCTSVGS